MEQNCLVCARLESLQNRWGRYHILAAILSSQYFSGAWALMLVSFYYYYCYKILSKCTGKSICLESAQLKMSAKCARDLSLCTCTWNETSLCAGHMCQILVMYMFMSPVRRTTAHIPYCVSPACYKLSNVDILLIYMYISASNIRTLMNIQASGGNSLFPGGGGKSPKFPTKLSNFRQPPYLHSKRLL